MRCIELWLDAVLSHIMEGGTERSVGFAARTPNAAARQGGSPNNVCIEKIPQANIWTLLCEHD